jgi:uncharacterized protein YggT (Ycf19 family)
VQALLTDAMWVRPVVELAEGQSAAGGRAWLSRWDHEPGLAPFDVLGPTHGADNDCLWAHPPRFVERPLLARPGAEMTAADQAVTAALHAAVLGMVRTGEPAVGELAGWRPYEPGAHCTAVFDAVTRVASDPAASRRGGMTALLSLVALALLLVEVLLIARAVVDWVGVLASASGSRPGGARRVTHGLTEPLIGPVRRVLPPVRLGSVSIDLAFTVVFLAVVVLRTVVLAR